MSDNAAQNGQTSDRGPLVDALRTVMRAIGLGRNGTSAVRASLEELIEENGEDASPIDPHEGALISNVLGLRDITAYDVMVPRADIVAVDQEMTLQDLARQMSDAAHSRVPVYRGSLDDVVGMVHIKDVIARINRGEATTAGALVREILFVAPSSRALDLLQEMRMTRRHMALVVDEYGGIDGLITIEDLVEEIVGEIEDAQAFERSGSGLGHAPTIRAWGTRVQVCSRPEGGGRCRGRSSQFWRLPRSWASAPRSTPRRHAPTKPGRSWGRPSTR